MANTNPMSVRGAILALDRTPEHEFEIQPNPQNRLVLDADELKSVGNSKGIHSHRPHVLMIVRTIEKNNPKTLEKLLRDYGSSYDFSVLLRDPTVEELENLGQETLRGLGSSAVRAVEKVEVLTEKWPYKILATGRAELAV